MGPGTRNRLPSCSSCFDLGPDVALVLQITPEQAAGVYCAGGALQWAAWDYSSRDTPLSLAKLDDDTIGEGVRAGVDLDRFML